MIGNRKFTEYTCNIITGMTIVYRTFIYNLITTELVIFFSDGIIRTKAAGDGRGYVTSVICSRGNAMFRPCFRFTRFSTFACCNGKHCGCLAANYVVSFQFHLNFEFISNWSKLTTYFLSRKLTDKNILKFQFPCKISQNMTYTSRNRYWSWFEHLARWSGSVKMVIYPR